ncbi:MAG TPA: lysophospholipid acyltransferase family protein, partial [Rhodothermales bacterium]
MPELHDYTDAVRPAAVHRLHFIWFAVWALLVTIPASILQLTTHRFRPTAKNFKRWATWWGGTILRGCGIRVEVDDQAKLDPDKPYIFVSNHQNSLDILALAAALPYPFGFIAKAELERVPFLGFAIRNSASVLINRSDPRSSLESIRLAGERIRGGNSVQVFAEGSRSYAATVAPFKKGAFLLAVEAGVPLVPVAIVDAYRL